MAVHTESSIPAAPSSSDWVEPEVTYVNHSRAFEFDLDVWTAGANCSSLRLALSLLVDGAATARAQELEREGRAAPAGDPELASGLLTVEAIERVKRMLDGLVLTPLASMADAATQIADRASARTGGRVPCHADEVVVTEVVTAVGMSGRQVTGRLRLATGSEARVGWLRGQVRSARVAMDRAIHLVELTSELDDEAADRVFQAVLAPTRDGSGLTWGLMQQRARRAMARFGGDRATRRRTARSRVAAGVDVSDDGMATLTVTNEATKIVAAWERVESAARAARAHGDPRTLTQLRADLITGMLSTGWPSHADGKCPAAETAARDAAVAVTVERIVDELADHLSSGTVDPAIVTQLANELFALVQRTADASVGSATQPSSSAAGREHPVDDTDTSVADTGSSVADTGASDADTGASDADADSSVAGAEAWVASPETSVDDAEPPANDADSPADDGQISTEPCGCGAAGAFADLQPTAAATAMIVVPASTLLGEDDEPCEVIGHGWISASHAREAVTTPGSIWRTLLADVDTGRALALSTKAYRPTAEIIEFVRAVDGTCRGPGCPVPAHRCDLDHDEEWPGGATTPSNLSAKHRRHHRLRTNGAWTAEHDPDTRVITWTTAAGRRYTTHPADWLSHTRDAGATKGRTSGTPAPAADDAPPF